MATQSPSKIRINRRWINTTLFLLIILAVVVGFARLWWVRTLPERVDEQQTIVVGQTRFAPDSEGSVRVVVQDFGKGSGRGSHWHGGRGRGRRSAGSTGGKKG